MRSLLDAPCGDHRWMAGVELDLDRYVGMESSRRSSKTCGALPARHAAKLHLGDLTRDPLPRCDLILSRDCLVHFSFATLAQAMRT